MAFTAVLLFGVRSALLDTGEKMPPAGHRRPRKRREAGGEHRDTLDAKTRPRMSQGGQLLSDNQVGGRKLQVLPIPQSTR